MHTELSMSVIRDAVLKRIWLCMSICYVSEQYLLGEGEKKMIARVSAKISLESLSSSEKRGVLG